LPPALFNDPATEPNDDAIDAVVLWVDGGDPAHRAKLNQHLASLGRTPVAAAPTRFASVGEINHCLASLLRYAPFLRRIHVVTDAQVPPGFDAAQQIHRQLVLVDHRVVFGEHADRLPTFNCRPLETLLHRVPGLAERFVYFNDDVMLIKPVTAAAFFDGPRPVLYGRYAKPPDQRWSRKLRVLLGLRRERAGNADAQALAAQMLGQTARYFHAGHNPFALRRSTFERLYAEQPQWLRDNLQHRLRDASQYAPQSLANHAELAAGQAVTRADDACLYVKAASLSAAQLARRLERAEHDPRLVFACFQSLDEAPPGHQQQVLAWLERVVGRLPG
jgi:hypothetical protein